MNSSFHSFLYLFHAVIFLFTTVTLRKLKKLRNNLLSNILSTSCIYIFYYLIIMLLAKCISLALTESVNDNCCRLHHRFFFQIIMTRGIHISLLKYHQQTTKIIRYNWSKAAIKCVKEGESTAVIDRNMGGMKENDFSYLSSCTSCIRVIA